jgi:hypothetical protein
MEVVQHILEIFKRKKEPSNGDMSRPSAMPSPSLPSAASPQNDVNPKSGVSTAGVSSSPLSPRSSIVWASPLSPTSPLMEALSVSDSSGYFDTCH